MLAGADGCIVLTEGERRLVHDLAPDARTRLVGVGFDETEAPSAEATSRFCAERGIDPGYLLYAGRREAAKGLPEMFANYAELRRNVADAPKLALMGGGEIDLPADVAPHVIDLGFVDDGDRGAAYAAASVLLHPSRLESLGMVLLESWLAGTPAVVNGASPVLHEHCAASGGGLWYREGAEMVEAVALLLEDADLRARMARAGGDYVRAEYSWPVVRRRFHDALEAWSAPAGATAAPVRVQR